MDELLKLDLPTGENMLFAPTFACPTCKKPLAVEVSQMYDPNGQPLPATKWRLHLVCLYGCNYNAELTTVEKPEGSYIALKRSTALAVIEGARLCLVCNSLHLKDAEGTYCPKGD
jgi:hypothetical protein